MEDLYKSAASNLFPGLDNDTVNALNSAEKNWNDEFKNGTLKQGLPAMASAMTENVNFAANAPQLVTYVTNYVTQSVMSYLTGAITDMLSIDLSKITTKAASYMPTFIISPGVIMKELLTAKESLMDEKANLAELNITEGISKEINGQVAKLTSSINKKLEPIQGTITEISKYAAMGPGWVKNKIDVESNKIIESCQKEIAQKRDTVKTKVDKTIDNVAEKIGQKMADKINKQVKETQKASLDEINKAKQQAITKAKTAITNAKLKLMALIGI